MANQDRAPAAGRVASSNVCTPTDSGEAPLRQAALEYARHGWLVFPCHTSRHGRCSCQRSDCSHVGKHPRTLHGVKDATRDPAVINDWWKRYPEANIAIATGAASNLVVCDEDPRHGGDETLRALEQRYSPFPTTVKARTGGGGGHALFQHPGRIVRNAVNIAPGLDIRGDGGYVIAPPSMHASGQCYAWVVGHAPDDTPLAPLPEWLLAMITVPPSTVPAMKSADCEEFIHEGVRNTTLFKLACAMRRHGAPQEAILAALEVVNRLRCHPPLDHMEMQRIAVSAARYPTQSYTASRGIRTIDARRISPWR
jgi:putative DNA primase/helicase